MTGLLEGIEADVLLQQVPTSVRVSLETLERNGTDWNAVGILMTATPTAGVALSGNGQWTGDLWDAVKWEFRSFLCTDSEWYAEPRLQWDALKHASPGAAIGMLATRMGARLGVSSGLLVPLVTWLLVVARRTGEEDACTALSTAVPVTDFLHARQPFS